jgi:all-trans-8'-apo-beta-carotenal 15,15'-oxygenase
MGSVLTNEPAMPRAPAEPALAARTVPQESPPRFMRELFRRSLPREHGFEPLRVEGQLPPGLEGTLYRNGPGNFQIGSKLYRHPFDGDGVLSAVRIAGGGAQGAARVVETEGLKAERRVGKILFGGAAPWWRRLRNAHLGPDKVTANTSVVSWQGRLLALNEGSPPVEVDPHTLATIGETDLEGAVPTPFSAHPHYLPARRAAYNIGLEYGKQTFLHLYELPDAGPLRNIGKIALEEAPMVHDFAATPSHLVFFISPVRLRLLRYLAQLDDFGGWFGWRPDLGTKILVVPIDRPQEHVRFTAEPFFQWHFANAFHRGPEVVVDYVRFPDLAPYHALTSEDSSAPLRQARYHRALVDPRRQTFRSEPLGDFGCEFPRVHPRIEGQDHGTTWLTRGDTRALLRVDPRTGRTATFAFPAGEWVSEPVFVPRRGARPGDERDGHVLALCHHEPRDVGFLAVFDAARFEDGPAARIWFDHYLPVTFHGIWVDS